MKAIARLATALYFPRFSRSGMLAYAGLSREGAPGAALGVSITADPIAQAKAIPTG
jgi:hypothetical protein